MSEPTAASARPWTEPTRRLPLRSGRYADRLGIGLALIAGGGAMIAGANTFQLLALLGTLPHVVGWAVLPAEGWRRVLVAVPSTAACWLLLTGPRFLLVLVVPYLCWMLVRERPPGIAVLTALLPAAAAVVIAVATPGYAGMLAALAIEVAALVAAALSARVLASRRAPRRPETPLP